jgi:ABC-type multidrug transport system ATPase subunit
MGRLGLSGEKAVRRICDLSGGEKARVALSMFALRASNAILFDEPSNHLDVECIDALSNSLVDWGKENGAIVVISHDHAFCKRIPFTHVATVEGGMLTVEQRSTLPSDWDLFEDSSATARLDGREGSPDDVVASESIPQIGREKQKQAYNAPKRIAKIEKLVEEAERRIEMIDSEMLANGSDVGILCDLSEKRQNEVAKVEELMLEWEQLEELLIAVG